MPKNSPNVRNRFACIQYYVHRVWPIRQRQLFWWRNVDKSINIDTRVLTDSVGAIIPNGASTPENVLIKRIMLTCVGSGYENNRKNCLEFYMLFSYVQHKRCMGSLINNFIKVWEQDVFANHDSLSKSGLRSFMLFNLMSSKRVVTHVHV